MHNIFFTSCNLSILKYVNNSITLKDCYNQFLLSKLSITATTSSRVLVNRCE